MSSTAAALLVVGSAVWAESTVGLLDAHSDALWCRVEIVEEATTSIDVSTFIVETDRIALGWLALLSDAAERGVRVRLLLDAAYNRLDRRIQGQLIASGVQIREYHPFRPHKPLWITRRLHDKLVLVDQGTLVIGGRNVSEPYFGLSDKTYIDRDVVVTGPAASQAQAYFDSLWESSHVRAKRGAFHPDIVARDCTDGARGRSCRKRRTAGREGLDWARSRLEGARDELFELELLATGRSSWRRHQTEVASVNFLHDPVGNVGGNGVGRALKALFDQSLDRVLIESPYLVTSRGFRRSLRQSQMRGLGVRILTNSLLTTDNLWPQAGYVGEKKWLRRMGVDLWEVIGKDTLHSKSAVFDGRVGVVGSFNLDPRSQRLNTEVAVVVEDMAFAARLEESMEADFEQAWRIDERGIPEGHVERFPGISTWKKIKLCVLRALTPLIRKQL